MNTSFKRNDVQVYIETAQKCFEIEKWSSYKHLFINWEISKSDLAPLNNCLESDLTSYFFKAFETFSQAIIDIHKKKYSWATVKLYYTVFYLLRCDILLSNYLIVRCNGLYYSKVSEGNKFTQYIRGKIRGDHQLTISLVKELYKNNQLIDPILDNLIEDVDAYTWLMQNRERINYQQKNFVEPGVDYFFHHINDYFYNYKLIDLLKFYNTKDYSICFDLDHSIMSIPYKKLIQIWKKSNGKIDLSDNYLKKIIFYLEELRSFNFTKSDLYDILN